MSAALLALRIIIIPEKRDDIPIKLFGKIERYDICSHFFHMEAQNTGCRPDIQNALPSKIEFTQIVVDRTAKVPFATYDTMSWNIHAMIEIALVYRFYLSWNCKNVAFSIADVNLIINHEYSS